MARTPTKSKSGPGKDAKDSKDAKETASAKDAKEKDPKAAAKGAAGKPDKGDKGDKGEKAEVKKPLTKAAPSRPVKPPRDEDDDGFDDDDDEDEDEDLAPKKKAGAAALGKAPPFAAKGAKGAAAAGGKAVPGFEDFEDDEPIGPVFEEEEEDDFAERGAPKRSSASEADAAALEAESRRPGKKAADDPMRKKLIELGKQKGFVTYDEVNDHMPEDVVSTDQIDSWLSALGDHGIEVVDSTARRAAGDLGDAPKGLELGGEAKEKEEGEVDEDEEYAYSRTSDPVRMYLRKMGSVSLLTREGEVEIAKRIEDGERKMLQAVLNSSVAVEELLEIGERLRRGKVRVKDVVKDIDEDEEDFNEQFYVERVCKIIDKVRKLQRETEKLEEKMIDRNEAESKKKKIKEGIKANRGQMFEELSDLRLNKPTVDRIVAQLKNLIIKLDKAETEVRECERRCGMSASDIRKTLREMRAWYWAP